jgi:hypothetical protein
MRLGVEGGPADGREVVVEVVGDRPPGERQLDGALYVLRMFGAAPHEDADWHYCWLRP